MQKKIEKKWQPHKVAQIRYDLAKILNNQHFGERIEQLIDFIEDRDNHKRNATIELVEKKLIEYDTGYGDLCMTIKELEEELIKLKRGID